MTFHDMRHTAVAMWVAIGSNDLQVAKWAGHRSVSFTKDRYGHLFSTDPEAAMAALTHSSGRVATGPRGGSSTCAAEKSVVDSSSVFDETPGSEAAQASDLRFRGGR